MASAFLDKFKKSKKEKEVKQEVKVEKVKKQEPVGDTVKSEEVKEIMDTKEIPLLRSLSPIIEKDLTDFTSYVEGNPLSTKEYNKRKKLKRLQRKCRRNQR